MCVDDYEFRHQSATRPKICRRFIFRTHDGNERVFLVNISQFEFYGDLRLCEILLHLHHKGLNVKDFRFYLPKFDITIEAGDECLIPFQTMSDKEVVFVMERIEEPDIQLDSQKFNSSMFCSTGKGCRDCLQYDHHSEKKKQSEEMEMEIEENSSEEDKFEIKEEKSSSKEKKVKQHEKTIQQALFKTKFWRMLHQIANFSLKNAAKYVGLSKKTLDDYFLVLRVGQQLGYNYKQNKEKKIGHLRSFIRNQPIKVKGRLHKTVKSFDLVPDPDLSQYQPMKDLSKIIQVEEEVMHQDGHFNQGKAEHCIFEPTHSYKQNMMEEEF